MENGLSIVVGYCCFDKRAAILGNGFLEGRDASRVRLKRVDSCPRKLPQELEGIFSLVSTYFQYGRIVFA